MKSSAFKGIIATLIFVPAFSVAQTWTAPTQNPPAGNVSAPLNVSSVSQVKVGGLSAGSLISTGGICFGADCKTAWSQIIDTGSVAQVKVGGLSVGSLISTGAICFGVDCKTSWSDVVGGASVPAGAVMAFDLASCPSGWSDLVSARGRTIVGVGTGSGLTARTLGSMFGAEQHTLTANEIPAHSHQLYVDYQTGGYDKNWGFGRSDVSIAVAGKENVPMYKLQNASGVQLIADSGGGQPHNNMQPSLALLYCRKN